MKVLFRWFSFANFGDFQVNQPLIFRVVFLRSHEGIGLPGLNQKSSLWRQLVFSTRFFLGVSLYLGREAILILQPFTGIEYPDKDLCIFIGLWGDALEKPHRRCSFRHQRSSIERTGNAAFWGYFCKTLRPNKKVQSMNKKEAWKCLLLGWFKIKGLLVAGKSTEEWSTSACFKGLSQELLSENIWQSYVPHSIVDSKKSDPQDPRFTDPEKTWKNLNI